MQDNVDAPQKITDHIDRFGNHFGVPRTHDGLPIIEGDGRPCCPLEYIYDDDDDIMNIEEEVEITVASDSGCVAHVVSRKELPRTVEVRRPEDGRLRNFVGANNSVIKHHGQADVALILDDGKEVNGTFQVADVTRPLHSTGQTCDENKEMLYTKDMAVVVPAGALSKFLGAVKHIATYKRKPGGLYLAKMKARARRNAGTGPPESPFGGQGTKR